MKKFFTAILLISVLAFAACTSGDEQVVQDTPAPIPTPEATPEPTPEPAAEAYDDYDGCDGCDGCECNGCECEETPAPPLRPVDNRVFTMGINLDELNESLNANPAPASEDFNRRRDDVVYGQMQELEYFSNTTGAYRRVAVLTPPDFDPSQTYPVLYLFHGIGGSHREWLGGQPLYILGNLIADGYAEPMIVVLPNVRARYDDSGAGGHHSPENLAAFDNFVNDMRDDLMPFIEQNFPVTHNRGQTAIAGLSMGGRVALQVMAEMPEAFMYVGAFSSAPGLLVTGDGGTHAGVLYPEQLTVPAEIAENIFILLNNGDNEEMFERMTLMYKNALIENGVPVVYYVTPGGHDFSVWRNGLYHFARNIFQSPYS